MNKILLNFLAVLAGLLLSGMFVSRAVYADENLNVLLPPVSTTPVSKVNSQTNSAIEETFKKESVLLEAQARVWTMNCIIFAEDNKRNLPTNFDKISNYAPDLSSATSTNWEIVSSGNLNGFTNPSQKMLAVLLREKDSRQALDGKFVKVYSFVDGHVELVKSPDDDFTATEKKRGFFVNPQPPASP